MKMVDIGDKEKTLRIAVASAEVRMGAAARRRIRTGTVEKGDVLGTARLAAIMAAKRTPELLPLCHPISLSGVTADVRLTPTGVSVSVEVRTVDRTGVEMEALTAASAAALTVYDMLKSVDRGMVIGSVQLEHKSGGRSGTWERETPKRARPVAQRPRRS